MRKISFARRRTDPAEPPADPQGRDVDEAVLLRPLHDALGITVA